MRNLFLTFVLFFSFQTVFAQEETPASKAATEKYVSLYNAKQYDSLFALFTPEMQALLKTTEPFQIQQTQLGKIVSRKFIKYNATFALYSTKYERGDVTLNISVGNNQKINGYQLTAPIVSAPERNITKMKLPFKGEWTIFWGGDTKEQNYHVSYEAQKNAFDILIKDNNGKSFKTDGRTNEDYYAFGQELYAPCDGEIVQAVDGVKENIPGAMNPAYVFGNSVIIRTNKNEFLVFAHLKQYSVKVKAGQQIKQGALLGQCGNTGNSSEAHLHFHMQNVENLNTATGIKCYFDQLKVNGQTKTDYSPVKNDKVQSL